MCDSLYLLAAGLVLTTSTHRVQTSAEYFHVLFLAIYINRNSNLRVLQKLLDPDRDLNSHQNLIDCSTPHASKILSKSVRNLTQSTKNQ